MGFYQERTTIDFRARVDLKSLAFWQTDVASWYKLDQRQEAKWKAIALVFISTNKNLNRVMAGRTEMKEQMEELL